MAIIIKRKAVRQDQPVDELVHPRAPVPPKTTTAGTASLRVATSLEDRQANPNTTISPPATTCRYCGSSYAFPCHGESESCMNRRWAKERETTKHA